MPKQNKPKTTFSKALRSPGQRQQPRSSAAYGKVQMKKPTPRSEIVEHVESHREDERSEAETLNLVHEFQEVCKHERKRELVGQSPTKQLLKCPDCGDIKTLARK